MTFDECHETLTKIRRGQGTRFPKVRIDCGGQVFKGRVARSDSDPEHRKSPLEPTGALVLEGLGVGKASKTVVPLGTIGAEAIRPLSDLE